MGPLLVTSTNEGSRLSQRMSDPHARGTFHLSPPSSRMAGEEQYQPGQKSVVIWGEEGLQGSSERSLNQIHPNSFIRHAFIHSSARSCAHSVNDY